MLCSTSHCGGSLVAEHRLQGTQASVVLVHRLSCPKACGIFPDQGSNLCPLHWQADSYPLYHQGSPKELLLPFYKAFPLQLAWGGIGTPGGKVSAVKQLGTWIGPQIFSLWLCALGFSHSCGLKHTYFHYFLLLVVILTMSYGPTVLLLTSF